MFDARKAAEQVERRLNGRATQAVSTAYMGQRTKVGSNPTAPRKNTFKGGLYGYLSTFTGNVQ